MRRRLLLGVLANTFKWLKDKFIYIYNSIIPSKLPTINLWDEEWEVGDISSTTGQNVVANQFIRSSNYIKVSPNETYYFKSPADAYIYCYDNSKNYVGYLPTRVGVLSTTFIIPSNCCYIRFVVLATYGTTYNHDICINVSDPAINGIYFPYKPRKVQDKARLTMVEGNSEVKNQLVRNDYTDTTSYTFKVEKTAYSIYAKADFRNVLSSFTPSKPITGHKYLVRFTKSDSRVVLRQDSIGNISVGDNILTIGANDNKFYLYTEDASHPFIQGETYTGNIMIVDLTQRFPFDTPTSVNDPRVQNIIRQGYKDFNAGEIKDSVVSEIEHRRVPKGFKELTYIGSTGTQYIDSGYIFTSPNYSAELKIKFDDITPSPQRLIGAFDNVNQKRSLLTTFTTANGIYFQTDNDNQIGYSNVVSNISNTNVNNIKITQTTSVAKLKINDTEWETSRVNFNGYTNTPVHILHSNGNEQGFYGKLYACKFYDDGKLVRDFIPCYRESDNVIGLYDAVNGVFYTNAGTGTFIKGEEVEYTNNKILLPQPLKLGSAGSVHNTFEITKDNYVFTRNVEHKIFVGDSSENWQLYGIETNYVRFAISKGNIKEATLNLLNNYGYSVINNPPQASDSGLKIWVSTSYLNVFIPASLNITTSAGFKTYLASHNLEITAEITTPQVINIPRKRLGCVRLKGLTFVYDSTYNRFNCNDLSNLKLGAVRTIAMFSSEYLTKINGETFDVNWDKVIYNSNNTAGFTLHDHRFTSVEQLYAYFSKTNAILFYETQDEVADFTDELECQPNGVLNANQSRVPHEYQEVEYIESSGTQWIDSNVSLNDSDFDIKSVVTMTEAIPQEQPICSVWVSMYNYWNLFFVRYTADRWLLDIYANAHYYVTGKQITIGDKLNINVNRNSNHWLVRCDDAEQTFDYTPATINPTTLKLFMRGDVPDQLSSNAHIKMYSFTLKVAGVLVRDFIPCFRKSDGVIGLYDSVEGKFYTNQGTGTFLKGGNVDSPICETLPNVEMSFKCK